MQETKEKKQVKHSFEMEGVEIATDCKHHMCAYLGDNWDEDRAPLAHGRGGAAELLAVDFAAKGRWRTKGFEGFLEAEEENNCLLFS